MTYLAQLPLTVRVPGSTSNLGPGFDCLGLALGLFAEVSVLERRSTAGHSYRSQHNEALAWSGDLDDKFIIAVDRTSGRKPHEAGWTFRVDSAIPIARGIGSSGAAIAAGLLLGSALARQRVDTSELLRVGLELEGHPDNVTASLLGGLTFCAPLSNSPADTALLQPKIAESLGVVLAWSPQEMSTGAARAVLPSHVPFQHAVENPRRLALLLAGLESGDEQLLRAGAVDALHEPYRLPLVRGAAETLAAMRAAGAPLATLSGSGSALVAIAHHDRLEAIASAAFETLSQFADGVTARQVDVVHGPPTCSWIN